jgi:hypothetical protein
MRACAFQASRFNGVDVAEHKADAPQLSSSRRQVQWCPFVAVHHVAISVVSQEYLTDGASALATLVKH